MMRKGNHSIAFSERNGYLLIILEGEFSLYNVHEMREALLSNSDDYSRGVIVDMKGVSYMDSSAIGVLYSVRKKMNALGKEILISNISRDLHDVMLLAGISFNTIDLEAGV